MNQNIPSLEKFGWDPDMGFRAGLRSALAALPRWPEESGASVGLPLHLGRVGTMFDEEELPLVIDRIDTFGEAVGARPDIWKKPYLLAIDLRTDNPATQYKFVVNATTEHIDTNGKLIMSVAYNAMTKVAASPDEHGAVAVMGTEIECRDGKVAEYKITATTFQMYNETIGGDLVLSPEPGWELSCSAKIVQR